MIIFNLNKFLEKFYLFFFDTYETTECRVCKSRIRCKGEQFIPEESNKVKCTHCERVLETIKQRQD